MENSHTRDKWFGVFMDFGVFSAFHWFLLRIVIWFKVLFDKKITRLKIKFALKNNSKELKQKLIELQNDLILTKEKLRECKEKLDK